MTRAGTVARRGLTRSGLALLLSLTTCPPVQAAPLPVHAFAPARPSAGPAPRVTDDSMLRARAAYADGQVRFDLADYEGAIERWREAYGLLREPWQRARMTYNLAEAHMRAHEIDRDPAHLRQSRALFAQFVAVAPTIEQGRASLADDVKRATTRIEKIDRDLAELERTDAERRELLRAIAVSTFRPAPSPAVRAMRGTGIGLTVAGGVSLGLFTAGLAIGARARDRVGLASIAEDERTTLLRRGERANDLAVASGVIAAALLAIGVPLLIVAHRRAARERDEALQRLLPAVSAGSVGLVWEGKF